MQEGKTLFGISIEVIISVGFLSIICIIAGLYYGLWNNYARAEDSKASLAQYADMAAYDNTTVRGQDIVSLITSSKGNPFVLVTDSAGHVLASCYDGYTGQYIIKADCLTSAMDASIAGSLNGTTIASLATNTWNYDANVTPVSSDIQDFFLTGAGTSTSGYYSSYNTYVVYESDGSTAILGVIAQRN